jgi:hypothetical protein
MTKLVVDDPRTLYGVVTQLGGTVIPGRTFRFELPMAQVRDVVPKLNELGVRCERVAERVGDHPSQINRTCSYVTIALYKEPS